MEELRRLSPYDPEHLPAEITLIEAFATEYPQVPQVACFDTGFHQHLPPTARLLAIPRRYEKLGIRRYGFHGLSYAYLMEELGNGSSAAGARQLYAMVDRIQKARGGTLKDVAARTDPGKVLPA